MRSSKGQWTVGEVFLFSLSIVFALLVFMLMASSGNIVKKSVDKQVKYSIDEVRKRSVITVTMRDYMWRAPTRVSPGGGPTYAGIDKDKYGDMPAYKLISYYFSTSGQNIYVHGQKIPKSDVKSDIRSYLKYKMEKYWVDGPDPVDYYVNISAADSPGAPDPIVVSNGYIPSAKWSRVSYPIALSEGREATVTLWTKTSQNVYTVTPG